MSPILAIGTALAIYDQELLKRAAKTLGIEVLLSVLVACEFIFKPIDAMKIAQVKITKSSLLISLSSYIL